MQLIDVWSGIVTDFSDLTTYGLKADERELSTPPTLQWRMAPFGRNAVRMQSAERHSRALISCRSCAMVGGSCVQLH